MMRDSCESWPGVPGFEDADARARFISRAAARVDQLEASFGLADLRCVRGRTSAWKKAKRARHMNLA